MHDLNPDSPVKKLTPSNIFGEKVKGTPGKASFQLLGGLALVSTSQHTFHVPQVGSH